MQDEMPMAETLDFIEKLVKANQPILDEFEKDPELEKQYKEDAAKQAPAKDGGDGVQLKQMHDNTVELLSMLFNEVDQTQQVKQDPKADYLDIVLNRPIPYPYLRAAGSTEIPRMIKNLRRLQLTQYSHLAASNKYGKEVGFRLTWKVPSYKPTDEEKARLLTYEVKLQSLFFYAANETAPSLHKFLGNCYEDWFDLDDITFRVRRDATNYPIGITLEDPSLWNPTIGKVKRYPRHDQDMLEGINDGKDGAEVEIPEFDYIKIRNTKRLEAATSDHVFKSHFFVRSDFRNAMRGYSIMEQAIRMTTVILNAITYNAANFSMNRTPMGVLTMNGGFTNQIQIEKLKKVLWANMSGAANQRRIPIVGLPEKGEARWINIHGSHKEMEFYTGISLFSSIIFALSGTNPSESGMASFRDAMQGAHMNEASQDGVFRQSQDNGLKTFMSQMEENLNRPMSSGKNVAEEITGMPVKMEFKGMATEDLKTKNTVNQQRLQTVATINELREEEGLKPAKLMIGDVNIYDVVAYSNGSVAAAVNQSAQMAMAAQQQQEQQQQAEAATGQEGGGDGELTEKDKALMAKYGGEA